MLIRLSVLLLLLLLHQELVLAAMEHQLEVVSGDRDHLKAECDYQKAAHQAAESKLQQLQAALSEARNNEQIFESFHALLQNMSATVLDT